MDSLLCCPGAPISTRLLFHQLLKLLPANASQAWASPRIILDWRELPYSKLHSTPRGRPCPKRVDVEVQRISPLVSIWDISDGPFQLQLQSPSWDQLRPMGPLHLSSTPPSAQPCFLTSGSWSLLYTPKKELLHVKLSPFLRNPTPNSWYQEVDTEVEFGSCIPT